MTTTHKHVGVGLDRLPTSLQENKIPAAFRKALERTSG